MHTDARGYLYETFRDGGRVCRRYVGRGDWVEAALYLDRLDRQRDEEKRASEKAQIEAMKAPDAPLNAYCARSEALVSDAMTRAGYYRHKRGAWRKRRAKRLQTTEENQMPEEQTAFFTTRNPDDLAACAEATKSVAAARAFLDVFKGAPDEAKSLDILGSVHETAAEGLVRAIAGDDELHREATRRQLELTAHELAGPNASALELHVARRVALCELGVARLENVYPQSQAKGIKVSEAIGRALDAAHRRHLSAIKTLATVRKAQLPDVQINIGEKQVNIGTLETR